MAVNVGSLLVDLKTDTTKFVEGMNRANNHLDGFSKAAKIAGSAIAGMVSIAAISRINDMAKSAINAADELGGLANKLGIGVESLQEWQYVASQSNVSVDTLNSSIQRFSANVGELALQNKGELVPAFKALDISVKDSRGNMKSMDDLLPEYLNKLAMLEDTNIRNALAMDAFGKSGIEMVNISSQGADEIKRLTDEAHKFGIILDAELIKSADKTNDKLDLMQRIIDTQLTRAFIGLSPALISVAKLFADAATEAGRLYEAVRPLSERTNIQQLVESMGLLAKERNRLEESISKGTAGDGFLDSLGLEANKRKLIKILDDMDRVNARIKLLQGKGDEGPPVIKIPLDLADDDKQKELQKLQDDLMTQEEMLASSYGRRAEMIQKALDAKLISEQKANSLIREEQIKLMDGLAELQNQGSIKKELDQYLDNLKSKEEMTAEAYARRAEILQKAREQELIDEEKFNGLMLYEQEKLVNDIATIRQSGAEKIREIEQNTISMSIGLLEMLGREHKDFARAYILISKGLSIALAIQNTAVAVTKALTIDPTGVLAARVKMMGAIQVGIIAATGALELASLNQGSGGGGSASSPTSPVYNANPVTGQPTPKRDITNIYVDLPSDGRFTGQQVIDLIDMINDASLKGDVRVIHPESRNAIDIRNAS